MPTAAALFASTRAATRRRAIALWLALLLPALQALAGWHAVSHLGQHPVDQMRVAAEPGSVDPRAASLQACELCLTLAGVTNAVPAPAPPAVVSLHAAPVMAPVVPAPRAGVASLLAYQGRAPPICLL